MTDVNRSDFQFKRRAAMIMAAGAEIRTLRDAYVVFNDNIVQVVDPHLLANPAIISNRQPPGILDSDMGLDDHAFADRGTEPAQQRRLES